MSLPNLLTDDDLATMEGALRQLGVKPSRVYFPNHADVFEAAWTVEAIAEIVATQPGARTDWFAVDIDSDGIKLRSIPHREMRKMCKRYRCEPDDLLRLTLSDDLSVANARLQHLN